MDAVIADIEQGDTERKRLIDIVADHAAKIYKQYKWPEPYCSRRFEDGHAILIVMADYERVDMAALLAAVEGSR